MENDKTDLYEIRLFEHSLAGKTFSNTNLDKAIGSKNRRLVFFRRVETIKASKVKEASLKTENIKEYKGLQKANETTPFKDGYSFSDSISIVLAELIYRELKYIINFEILAEYLLSVIYGRSALFYAVISHEDEKGKEKFIEDLKEVYSLSKSKFIEPFEGDVSKITELYITNLVDMVSIVTLSEKHNTGISIFPLHHKIKEVIGILDPDLDGYYNPAFSVLSKEALPLTTMEKKLIELIRLEKTQNRSFEHEKDNFGNIKSITFKLKDPNLKDAQELKEKYGGTIYKTTDENGKTTALSIRIENK